MWLLAPIAYSPTGLRKPLSGLEAHAAKIRATTSIASIEGTCLMEVATFKTNTLK
jgi:hypothetical protein